MEHDSILIVDDNPADIVLTEKVIKKSRPGITIEHAANGLETLDLLDKGNLPALIFLDYNMPGMDGIDVLKRMRNHPKTRYLPVVMLTSSNDDVDIKNSFNAGASFYLHKTYDLDTFTREIQVALHYWLDLNLSPDKAA